MLSCFPFFSSTSSSKPSQSPPPQPPPCVFCEVTTEKGFKIIYEDSGYVVFRDRTPGSKVHLLAVPKIHIDNVKSLTRDDVEMVKELGRVGTRALDLMGVPRELQLMGFHIPPFYSIKHLHLHLLSLPLPFPSSLKYCPSTSSSLLPRVFDQTQSSRERGIGVDEYTPLNSSVEEKCVGGGKGTGEGKEGRKWIRAKGWCWFASIDQTLAILNADQQIKVGSVKIPSSTRSGGTKRGGTEGGGTEESSLVSTV